MVRWRAEVIIARPIADVFAFVADMRNDPKWCRSVAEVRQNTGKGPGTGAAYDVIATPFIRRQTQQYRTLTCEPPRQMSWEAKSGRSHGGGMYTLTKVAQGTLLVHDHWLSFTGAYRMLEPFIGWTARRVSQSELNALKRLLESTT